MGDHYQKALKYLAAGDVKAATDVHNEITAIIQLLEDDRDFIVEMIERYQEGAPAPKGGRSQPKGKASAPTAPIPPRLRKISQVERSDLIRKQALNMASNNGEKVKISAIEEAIKNVGVDIGTKVPGTVIANVLMKTPGWKHHKGTGVFEREQQ